MKGVEPMPLYAICAIDRNGQSVQDCVSARSREAAEAIGRSRGYTGIRLFEDAAQQVQSDAAEAEDQDGRPALPRGDGLADSVARGILNGFFRIVAVFLSFGFLLVGLAALIDVYESDRGAFGYSADSLAGIGLACTAFGGLLLWAGLRRGR